MMRAKIVMNTKTAELAEMTKSWMGLVIWLLEFDDIPDGVIATFPYVIYQDDPNFKDWKVIGDL